MGYWSRVSRGFSGVAIAAVLAPVTLSVAGAQGPGGSQAPPPVPAQADICRDAAKSLDEMRAAGIEGLIAKGPEWAKSGASKDEIARIRRFMALQEQVLFKCPVEGPPAVTASGEPPPLPERRPRTAKTRRLAPDKTGIPLPVQKKSLL